MLTVTRELGLPVGKLHVTKPVSISFQLQISPAKISLLLSRPQSCRNRCNCSSKLYSEVLVAFYFRALLPGRIPLFLHLLVLVGLVSLSHGFNLFLLLFQDFLNLTEFFVLQKGKCASVFTEVAVNTLQKPS